MRRLALTVFALALGCDAGDESGPRAVSDAAADAPGSDGGADGADPGEADEGVNDPADAASATDAAPPFDAGPLHKICDGTSELRFAARIAGRYSAQPDMMAQIGMAYLYVRGDCVYWVNTRVGGFAQTKQGRLSEDDELRLSADFGYGNWDVLQSSYAGGGPSETTLVLYDGSRIVACAEEACSPYGADMGRTLVSRLEPAFYAWLQTLDGQGSAFLGDIRALVRSFEGPEDVAFAKMGMYLIRWPYTWPLGSLASTFESSGSVCAMARADDLRSLRDKFVSGGAVSVPGSSVRHESFAVQDGDNVHTYNELWFRDFIPLEQDGGGIPLDR
jgi:hypothetical protein